MFATRDNSFDSPGTVGVRLRLAFHLGGAQDLDIGEIAWTSRALASNEIAKPQVRNSHDGRWMAYDSDEYRDNFQYQVNYTLMFFRHDTGTSGAGFGGSVNNHFCIPCEWARSTDFQRHTLRANGIYRFPYDITVAGAYLFGSGNYYRTTFPGNPTGAAGTSNRYRPDFSIIERNSLKGDYLSKVDLRVSKAVQLGGDVRLTGYAEVFNLLNPRQLRLLHRGRHDTEIW